jgi:hypothetical protein
MKILAFIGIILFITIMFWIGVTIATILKEEDSHNE